MDTATIVLGVLLAAVGGFCAWLLMQRERLVAGELRARANAEREAARALTAEAELAASRDRQATELAALRQSNERAAEALSSARAQLARLEAEHAGDLKRHDQHVVDLRTQHEQSLAARDRQHAAAIDATTKQLTAQLDAATAAAAEKITVIEREHARARQLLETKLADITTQSRETFEALAARTLKESTEQLLKRAAERFSDQDRLSQAELDKRREKIEQLVRPLTETLTKQNEKLDELEKKRLADRSTLEQQLRSMNDANSSLRSATDGLTRALSRPEVRGRYGELQLRRVAELAGMVSYCDFTEQASSRDDSGTLKRPDMLVKLPNDRLIAVDAKCPIYKYVQALDTSDEDTREALLSGFADDVAEQAKKLAAKRYWSNLEGSPEFVVMFVPGDHFLDAALERRPDLLEVAAQQNVILATPATLIGLLRAVAVGWQEAKLARDARELLDLGRELHARAATAFEHMTRLGDALGKSVDHFNKLVSSTETRLMPQLRRLEDVGVKGAKEMPELKQLDAQPRAPTLRDAIAPADTPALLPASTEPAEPLAH